MCGFAGEFIFGQAKADAALVDAMVQRLNHRGPDQVGNFLSADKRCAIGFRRLAVIDPAGSRQPMSSSDGNVTVAMNGEIYNFRALREELAADGAHFRTAGDTEVLIHLYERYRGELATHMDGMFAFVVYDSQRGELLVGRDRLGQKPLWYARLSDRVVFASEAKALLAHPGIDKRQDMLAIQQFLSIGYVPAPRSAWLGVRKCLPAHVLQFPEEQEQVRYWSPKASPLTLSPAEILERIRLETSRSIEAAMVSDVPIGALLSGGVDSSVVVAVMSKVAGRSGGVRTFTAGFGQAQYDERRSARIVADHCGTEHTELLVMPEPAGMIEQIIEMYDEPFADSSALPTWLICRAASHHVKVALVGDGGDEVFGGYDRYRAVQLGAQMGPGMYAAVRLGAALARPWAGKGERGAIRRLIRFADALPLPPAAQYFKYRRLFGPGELARLFTEEFAAGANLAATAEWFEDLYEQGDLADEITRAQRHDMLTYLPDDLLVKTDIASMANSLELRAPMLDWRLTELGLSLPAELKIGWRRGKVGLRDAFADMLPAQILARPKRGFGVPLADWLRNELRETLVETLTDRSLLDRGIFRPEALVGLINDHLSGRDDHSHRLWALLVLAKWWAKHG